MAGLINLNLGWMTIEPWLPYDPTTDFAFGAKAKSFDLFTPARWTVATRISSFQAVGLLRKLWSHF